MVKHSQEFPVDQRSQMRGGNGVVKIQNFVTSQDLNEKGRLFGTITLEPGCSIGYHTHDNDSELFYILEGEGQYDDNGTVVTVKAGDVTYTPAGTGHSIANNSTQPLKLVALIVYA